MKTIEFNANENVKVKLTEFGEKILKDDYDRLRLSFPKMKPYELRLDKDGYYETQLWHLMSTFGQYMELGRPEPFHLDMIFVTEK